MADYISREAVKSKKVYSVVRHELVVPVAEIDWIPAADVRPVVHGKWIVDSIASNIFNCSICGQDAPVEPTGGTEYKSNFCPNCGADMREVQSDG